MFSDVSTTTNPKHLEGDSMWFRRAKKEPAPDPLQIALDATIAELRGVGSELQQTYEVFKAKINKSSEAAK